MPRRSAVATCSAALEPRGSGPSAQPPRRYTSTVRAASAKSAPCCSRYAWMAAIFSPGVSARSCPPRPHPKVFLHQPHRLLLPHAGQFLQPLDGPQLLAALGQSLGMAEPTVFPSSAATITPTVVTDPSTALMVSRDNMANRPGPRGGRETRQATRAGSI